MSRTRLAPLLALLCLSHAASAAPLPATLNRAKLEQALYDQLRESHNRGADLYNAGDPGGCCQHFEGTLRVVAVLLDHRPEVQKVVRKSLAEATGTRSLARRAFVLRSAVVTARDALQPSEADAVAEPPERGETLPAPRVPVPPVPPEVLPQPRERAGF